MRFLPTEIPDVVRVEPQVIEDHRGYFFECWNASTFEQAGLTANFVQDNQSKSAQGSLRGLHYQIRHAQGKLVRVLLGTVFDVAVDLRRSSPTFGRWVGFWLSAEDKGMAWIPEGFAHGFYVTSPTAELVYKCTDFYSPEDEHTLRWDDPDLGIEWPLIEGQAPTLSAKDANGVPFRKAERYP